MIEQGDSSPPPKPVVHWMSAKPCFVDEASSVNPNALAHALTSKAMAS
jgi:hypothetical protein